MDATFHNPPQQPAGQAPAGVEKPHSTTEKGEPPVGAMGVDAFWPTSGQENEPQKAEGRRSLRPPQLDARLRAAADWVEVCDVCADIGCDHGRFGAVLLRENRCKHLLAADVSAKALDKARVRLGALGYANRTTFAMADGLNALDALPQRRADTVCILGMGSDTVAGILQRGHARLQGATLILGAQTDLPLARKALQAIGYQLTDEQVVSADGRLYLLMRATPAPDNAAVYTERELLLGPCLLRQLPLTWRPWLQHRQGLLTASVTAMLAAPAERTAPRLALAQRELAYTADALQALDARHGHTDT